MLLSHVLALSLGAGFFLVFMGTVMAIGSLKGGEEKLTTAQITALSLLCCGIVTMLVVTGIVWSVDLPTTCN